MQRFYAAAYNATNQPATATFTWAVTSGIGTVDANGVFYAGSSPSSGSVTATASGISGSASITVTDRGAISGRLTNSEGGVVSGVAVYITNLPSFSATSDLHGDYSIASVYPGSYEVKTRENLTYISSTGEARVEAGGTASANLALTYRVEIISETIQSSPILVTGTVRNNGSTEAQGVAVTYTFFDATGGLLGGASQALGSITAGNTANFGLVPYPPVATGYASKQRTVAASGY